MHRRGGWFPLPDRPGRGVGRLRPDRQGGRARRLPLRAREEGVAGGARAGPPRAHRAGYPRRQGPGRPRRGEQAFGLRRGGRHRRRRARRPGLGHRGAKALRGGAARPAGAPRPRRQRGKAWGWTWWPRPDDERDLAHAPARPALRVRGAAAVVGPRGRPPARVPGGSARSSRRPSRRRWPRVTSTTCSGSARSTSPCAGSRPTGRSSATPRGIPSACWGPWPTSPSACRPRPPPGPCTSRCRGRRSCSRRSSRASTTRSGSRTPRGASRWRTPAGLAEFGMVSAGGVSVEELARSLEVFRADGSPRPVEEAPPLRALRGELVIDQEEIVRTPATGELRNRLVSATSGEGPGRQEHRRRVGGAGRDREQARSGRPQGQRGALPDAGPLPPHPAGPQRPARTDRQHQRPLHPGSGLHAGGHPHPGSLVPARVSRRGLPPRGDRALDRGDPRRGGRRGGRSPRRSTGSPRRPGPSAPCSSPGSRSGRTCSSPSWT